MPLGCSFRVMCCQPFSLRQNTHMKPDGKASAYRGQTCDRGRRHDSVSGATLWCSPCSQAGGLVSQRGVHLEQLILI
jgi:hypothetical protein